MDGILVENDGHISINVYCLTKTDIHWLHVLTFMKTIVVVVIR